MKFITFFKEQLQSQFSVHKVEVTKKWDECTALILEKLAVTENRMQEIEVAHFRVTEFSNTFGSFQQKITKAVYEIENLREIPLMIER